MAVPSRSGFRAAIGSYADILTKAGAMPGTYIALFLIGAAQAFAYLAVDKTGKLTGEYTTQTLTGDIAGFAGALLLIPFGVGLLRYFTRAAPFYPSNLVPICLRVVGWTLVLGVLYVIAVMAIAITSAITAGFGQDMPALMAIGFLLLALVIVAFIWIGLRLSLFYAMISRSEPSPISGSFRQTKGWAFFIFRTFFFAFLIGIPIAAALLMFQLSLFGLTLEDLFAGNVLPMLEAQPLERSAILAAFSGLITVAVTVFYTALQGRIFRAIRGID
jgi:hypothetical protein